MHCKVYVLLFVGFGTICESQTMQYQLPMQSDPESGRSFTDSLRNTSLKCVVIMGEVGEMLLPILRGLAANTSTVERTVRSFDEFPLSSCE